MQTFEMSRGTRPLLISMPHQGTSLAPEMSGTVTPEALKLADTDWHLKQLYNFATEVGASIIWPHYSRYVIDLNRPPDNANLYPGANSTELCPTSTFGSKAIYLPGNEPDDEEVSRRLTTYWQPYHNALNNELHQIRQQFGIAVLFDAHSIRSQVPRLFEGRLPDLNIGTSSGASCGPTMEAAALERLSGQKKYTLVSNQRFKGGYITRAYGNPDQGIHAMQLELVQRAYMEESHPFNYLPARASDIKPLLVQLISRLAQWAEQQ